MNKDLNWGDCFGTKKYHYCDNQVISDTQLIIEICNQWKMPNTFWGLSLWNVRIGVCYCSLIILRLCEVRLRLNKRSDNVTSGCGNLWLQYLIVRVEWKWFSAAAPEMMNPWIYCVESNHCMLYTTWGIHQECEIMCRKEKGSTHWSLFYFYDLI